MRYEFGGLIFEAAYTWRGLLSEFYGICSADITEFQIKKPLGEKVSNTSPADEKSTVSPAHDTPIYTTTTLLQAHYWPQIKTPSHPLFRLSKKSPVRSNMARDLKVT